MFNQGYAVRLLLARGADTNTRGGCHGYPIIAAIRNADLRVLRALLDYGADPNVAVDLYGYVLHAAISDNHVGESSERVQILLNAGANPNAHHEIHGTPLLAACYNDNYSAAHLLLQAEADPNTVHGRRGAPLLAAAHRAQIPIADMLVEHGANKEVCGWIDGYERGGGQFDLLSAALSSRRPDVVQWALRSGFGTRDYWKSGAFKNSLAKFPVHRDLGKLKIYPMIYNHARQRGHSMTKRKTANPLATLINPRSSRTYADE
jgi:ankyrin repeat protein